MSKELIKKIKKFFKEEDEIISRAMGKVSYLMISRNISQESERKELEELRNKLIKELEIEE